MRLTDRFTYAEKRGLLILLLVMTAIVIALALHSYGSQRPVVIVRDTVTCFIENQPDSTAASDNRHQNKSKSLRKSRSSKKHSGSTPSRNPLDEPVPVTAAE
ncbi:MAG: hypothetical protein K2L90_03750 [Muribaculaceae bacterium]|nr:hypothetical protein [Muribaculaceae bacterium]